MGNGEPDGVGEEGRRVRSDERTGRAFDLHSVVVSYEDGPDRCTIYPRRRSCRERTEAWLSADLDAFEDLAERR